MKKILMTLTLALAAAIAIPASAQSTTTASEQKTQCCKEKKECAKEGNKECAKEAGKPCCKEGKAGQRKMKDGRFAKGDRKMNAPKDARMAKHGRRDGENPMFKGITLSDEQKAKMKALRESSKTAERKSKADMKAKNKDEMQKLRAEFDREVEKILDKDQLKQYHANKAEMESRRAAKQAKLPKTEKKDK